MVRSLADPLLACNPYQVLVQLSTSFQKGGGAFLQVALTFLTVTRSDAMPDVERPVIFVDNGPGAFTGLEATASAPPLPTKPGIIHVQALYPMLVHGHGCVVQALLPRRAGSWTSSTTLGSRTKLLEVWCTFCALYGTTWLHWRNPISPRPAGAQAAWVNL